jgi:thiosulfate reductase cytochrome b subunit
MAIFTASGQDRHAWAHYSLTAVVLGFLGFNLAHQKQCRRDFTIAEIRMQFAR